MKIWKYLTDTVPAARDPFYVIKVYDPQILAKGKNILCDKVYKKLRSISEISFAFSKVGEKLGSFHRRGEI